jgi:hypothetical protein
MKIPDGTYQANATHAVVYKSPAGAGIIAIKFDITTEGHETEKIASRQCLVRKDGSPSDIGIESMKKSFGWDGGNPYRLAEMICDGNPHTVDLVLETETFTGSDGTLKEISSVKWINPVGGATGGSLPESTDEASFMAEFGAVFGVTAPAPTSPPTLATSPPPISAKVKDPGQAKAAAWAACQRGNPEDATTAWSDGFNRLFKVREADSLSAAEWDTLAAHFLDTAVPF